PGSRLHDVALIDRVAIRQIDLHAVAVRGARRALNRDDLADLDKRCGAWRGSGLRILARPGRPGQRLDHGARQERAVGPDDVGSGASEMRRAKEGGYV